MYFYLSEQLKVEKMFNKLYKVMRYFRPDLKYLTYTETNFNNNFYLCSEFIEIKIHYKKIKEYNFPISHVFKKIDYFSFL